MDVFNLTLPISFSLSHRSGVFLNKQPLFPKSDPTNKIKIGLYLWKQVHALPDESCIQGSDQAVVLQRGYGKETGLICQCLKIE